MPPGIEPRSFGRLANTLPTPSEFERILNNKITDSFNVDHRNISTLINCDTTKFASKLQIKDKLGN